MKNTRIPLSFEPDKKNKREQARYANARLLNRRRKRSYFLYYILLLFFVIIASVTLSVTVFFNIKLINVTGISKYTSEDIIEITGVKSGDNLFRINIENIENNILNELVYIDSVKIKRELPDKLYIECVQSEIEYSVKLDNERYSYVSKHGRVLEQDMTERIDTAIEVVGLDIEDIPTGGFITEKNSDKTYAFLKILEDTAIQNLQNITSIELKDLQDIKIVYDDRINIVVGNISDLSQKLKLVQYVIENKIGNTERGIIDIKNGDKAVFRPE